MTDSIATFMINDHRRCDHLFAACEQAANSGDWSRLETLHLVIQQHNAKEEGILYPMAEESAGNQSPEILSRLRAA
jgi:hemerythrin superfamily protein